MLYRYENTIEVFPGDEIRTKCVFKSTSKSVTTFQGDATSDEMCFGFLTVHPITNIRYTNCLSWNNISAFKLWNQNAVIDGCDRRVFSNYTHPDMARLYQQIETRCQPLSKCLEECKEVVKEFQRHPCMQGSLGEVFTSYARTSESVEVLRFYSKVQSCDLEIMREQLLEQMRNTDNTNMGAKIRGEFWALFLFVSVILMV